MSTKRTVEIRKEALLERIRIEKKRVAALENQLTFKLDESEKVLLEEKINKLYAEIDAKESELEKLSAPRSPEISGQLASTGLIALSVLTNEVPKVREAVIRFEDHFQVASERIHLLGYYKDLHDLLHRLQFQCYNPIVQEATRFPDDELGLENLMDHETTLQDIINELKRAAQQVSINQQDSIYDTSWIEILIEAQESLHQAIDSKEKPFIKRAILLLNRILAIHPGQINARLNETARTMRLPTLVEAMTGVCNYLANLELDKEKLEQFEIGVEELAEMNGNLTSLINDHDIWQQIDLELRRIQSTLVYDATDLVDSWPYLKSEVENLTRSKNNQWEEEIKEDIKKLDAIVGSDNYIRLKRDFRLFYRRMAYRFYQVDVDLKVLSDNLRYVGQPLASVMRILQ